MKSDAVTFYAKHPSCGIPDSEEAAKSVQYQKVLGPVPASEFDTMQDMFTFMARNTAVASGSMIAIDTPSLGRAASCLLLDNLFYTRYFRTQKGQRVYRISGAEFVLVMLRTRIKISS